MLYPGLYEQVINNALTGELAEIPEARKAVAPIDKAEASKVLAQYLADVVQKGLDNVLDNGGGISTQIELTNQIVALIQDTTKEADFAALGGGTSGQSSFLRFCGTLIRVWPWERPLRTWNVRKHLLRRARFSLGPCMSRRCSRNSRKRSYRPTGLTCWCPSSNGAACG